LQLGHRISVDLDFFTLKGFKPEEILDKLKKTYSISDASINKNSLTLNINYKEKIIKIDYLRYNYPLIKEINTIDKIKLFSVQDIAAMKLNAIINRGAKKDFYDIFELLQHYELTELIDFYKIKYPEMNTMILIKSLQYFDDAELNPEPISLRKINWQDVKKHINKQIKNFI